MADSQKIMFVYNARSSFMHSMSDLFRNTTRPSENPCKLCSITYSGVSMKKMGKKYITGLNISTFFIHKDEFTKACTGYKTTYPIVLLVENSNPIKLVSGSAFKAMNDLADLIGLKSLQMPKDKLYQCPECSLHYREKATAEKCQEWCSKYKSCNLDITKLSVEAAKGV